MYSWENLSPPPSCDRRNDSEENGWADNLITCRRASHCLERGFKKRLLFNAVWHDLQIWAWLHSTGRNPIHLISGGRVFNSSISAIESCSLFCYRRHVILTGFRSGTVIGDAPQPIPFYTVITVYTAMGWHASPSVFRHFGPVKSSKPQVNANRHGWLYNSIVLTYMNYRNLLQLMPSWSALPSTTRWWLSLKRPLKGGRWPNARWPLV